MAIIPNHIHININYGNTTVNEKAKNALSGSMADIRHDKGFYLERGLNVFHAIRLECIPCNEAWMHSMQ